MSRQFLPEWHRQWGVMLAWPHEDTDWLDNLAEAQACYLELAHAITRFENVLVICLNKGHRAEIESALLERGVDLARVYFEAMQYDDTWARDFGFITVFEQGKPLLLDFKFNAWGGKFESSADDQINQNLSVTALFKHNRFESRPWVLEGGSIETDGLGTLLTTEYCLLNPNRNPELSRSDIESKLSACLGVERILWLTRGSLEGDDTDAHIDTLARFVDEQTIVYMRCTDPNDSHFDELKAMESELQLMRQPNGQPYRLIAVDMPAMIESGERRLGASYVNFLLVNGALLLPVYGDTEADTQALEAMGKACPDRAIVPVNCRALIEQNGSLHCITMQIPEEVVSRES